MNIDAIIGDIQSAAGTLEQVNAVVQQLRSGEKKLAIVPGTGPSIVVSKEGQNIGFGVPALPVFLGLGILLYMVSTRKR